MVAVYGNRAYDDALLEMYKKTIYIIIVAALNISLLAAFFTNQFDIDLGAMDWMAHWVSSPVALLLDIVFALILGANFEKFTKTMSKKMLQHSVIGLGFGMNVNQALASGKEVMLVTIVSVFSTLAIGWLIGRKLLKVDRETNYQISSGTAICGGSAIAAVGPTIKAKAESLSLFLIGAGLTRKTLKAVGIRPLIQGFFLWITISCVSLAYILWI